MMTKDSVMNILIIGADPFAEGATTGPPIYIRNLLEGFRGFPECKLNLLCLGRHEKPPEIVNGIKVYRIKEAIFLKTLLTPVFYKKKIQSIIKEISPDIIDLHMPHKGFILKGLKIPTVITVHGIVPEQLKHGIVPKHKMLIAPFYRKFWFEGFKIADCIICFNEHDVEYLKENNISKRVLTIPVPRSKRYFTNKEKDKYKVLSVGVLNERKNHLSTLKAIKKVKEKIPEIKFCIIGGVSGEGSVVYRQRLSDYISEHSLAGNVKIISGMENDQIINEYSTSALYIQFSTQESFPATVIEAFAGKTPVIGSDIPGTKEAIINGETGFLVDLNDIEELAQKIEYLLKNDNLRIEMGEKAQKYAKQRFSTETVARQRIDLYRELTRN